MSESEIHAVMKEQARKKQEDQRKFLEYSCNMQGDMEWHFRCCSYLTLPPPVQLLAATATLLQTTALPWHSSALSQMDRLRVTLCTRSTQARAGHL
jgi:hypothetical protein